MVAAAEQQQQQHQQKKQENNNNNSKKVKFNNLNKELEVCVFASSFWALFFVVVINFTVEIVVKIIQTFVFWYCRGSVVFSCFLLQLPPPPPLLLLACVVFSLFANCSRDIISRRWSYKPSPVLFVWHQVWTERASVKSVCCCSPSPFMFLILTLTTAYSSCWHARAYTWTTVCYCEPPEAAFICGTSHNYEELCFFAESVFVNFIVFPSCRRPHNRAISFSQ